MKAKAKWGVKLEIRKNENPHINYKLNYQTPLIFWFPWSNRVDSEYCVSEYVNPPCNDFDFHFHVSKAKTLSS